MVKEGKSLLGCEDCKSLRLLSFHVNDMKDQSPKKNSLSELSNEDIFDKYFTCFEGLGCISEPYHVKLDVNATPVIHPPRKIPAAIRGKVQQELEDMESKGMIKKVNEPTEWVNSMVVNEKRSGKLRTDLY